MVYFTLDETANEVIRAPRSGRKVANVSQGALSTAFVKEKLKGKTPGELARIVSDWRNIFQEWRSVEDVVVPYVSELFEIVCEEKPLIYKGVSYNPLINAYGENANILDFFGWLKAGGFRGIVLDASLYAVVNAAKTVPVTKFSSDSAVDAVTFLSKEAETRLEIKNSAGVRNRFLRAAATALFSPNSQPLVIDAGTLWSSERYLSCLQRAISFCGREPKYGDELTLLKYANYVRYDTAYQRWYTVLVLAEALYLYEVYGVNVKLGPTTETNFDSLIREFMNSLGIRYGFIWYDRGIEKQVPYPEFVFFGDDFSSVEKKLRNESIKKWLGETLKPFLENGDFDAKKVFDVIEKVRINAAKDIPPLPAEGSWFLVFPPGACD